MIFTHYRHKLNMPSPPEHHGAKEKEFTYQPLRVHVEDAENESPPIDLRTPVKSLSQGRNFASHHHYLNTPTARPHHGLLSNSPQLHTPNASGSVSRTLYLPRPLSALGNSSTKSTPHHTTPGGTMHKVVKNPFDSPSQHANLGEHVFTPNCFKNTAPGSAEKTPQSFRWSIDQQAVLYPADIPERPIQSDTLNIRKDRRTEEYLQEQLHHYFSQSIAASPLNETPPKHVLPATPDYSSSTMTQEKMSVQSCQPSGAQTDNSTKTPNEAELHSYDVSYEKEYVHDTSMKSDIATTADVHDTSMKSDIAITASADCSSLRRQLFFKKNTASSPTPPNPPRRRYTQYNDERYKAHNRSDGAMTAQFSSSPIKSSAVTASMRRSSTAPHFDLDLDASPIGHRMSPHIAGMHVISDIEDDDDDDDDVGFQPLRHGTFSPTGTEERMRRHTSPGLDLSDVADDEPIFTVGSQLSAHSSLESRSAPRSPSHSLFSSHQNKLKSSDFEEGGSVLSESDPTTSQDTGYNTETHIHTNLTTQFGAMLESMSTKPVSTLLKMDNAEDNDNAMSEMPSLIRSVHSSSTSEHQENVLQPKRPISISRQHSEPIIATAKLYPLSSSSFIQGHEDENQNNVLMKSLPEAYLSAHLHTGSVLISASRESSVAYEIPDFDEEEVSANDDPSTEPYMINVMHESTEPYMINVMHEYDDSKDNNHSGGSGSLSSSYTEHAQKPGASMPRGLDNDDWIMIKADSPNRQQPSGLTSTLHTEHAQKPGARMPCDDVEWIMKTAYSPHRQQPSGLTSTLHTEHARKTGAGMPRGVDWMMETADSPHRQQLSGLTSTLQRRKCNVNTMLPSEMANEVLKRAGGDYNRIVNGQPLDDTCCYDDTSTTDMAFTTS